MSIRSVQDILDIVKSRGLEIRVEPGPPPMPFLVIPGGAAKAHNEAKSLATGTLMEALKAWRLEIIEEIAGKQ